MVVAWAWQVARDLLAQMKVEGISPNEFTYNSLLRGYALRGSAFKNVRALHILSASCDPGNSVHQMREEI